MTRLIGLLTFALVACASAEPASETYRRLGEKHRDVIWNESSLISSRVSVQASFVVTGRGKDEFVIAIVRKGARNTTELVSLREGPGAADLCSSKDVAITSVPVGQLLGTQCGADDFACTIVNAYPVGKREAIRQHGLDMIRIDDQRCDAIWLYSDPSDGKLRLQRFN